MRLLNRRPLRWARTVVACGALACASGALANSADAPQPASAQPAQTAAEARVAAFGASLREIWTPPPPIAGSDEIGELIDARLKKGAGTERRSVKSRKAVATLKALKQAATRRQARVAARVAAHMAEEARLERLERQAALAEGRPPIPTRKPNIKPLVPAKLLFGAARSAAPLSARAIGFYSRGCLAGATAMPIDGPAWQVMRLSRKRNWGHPKLIAMLEKFSKEAKSEDGWPGLLVGDISQARGGPMLTGHSSHQIGLDADIWFTPMPDRRLSEKEREILSATSMISGPTSVDRNVFTDEHVRVVRRAALYPEVERILVHPAIKKAMCDAFSTAPPADKAWLAKVRPYFGHHYHFHVRMACPAGSPGCRPQAATKPEDGCGKELDDWFATLTRPPAPPPPGYKPPPPKPPVTLADMPDECRVVLDAGTGKGERDEAELIKTSLEASKRMIDISGEVRTENPLPPEGLPGTTGSLPSADDAPPPGGVAESPGGGAAAEGAADAH